MLGVRDELLISTIYYPIEIFERNLADVSRQEANQRFAVTKTGFASTRPIRPIAFPGNAGSNPRT